MTKPDHWDTGREILSQPEVWASWHAELRKIVKEISVWIETRRPDQIWLSGAGRPAFNGMDISKDLSRLSGRSIRAVASADLVGAPYEFFRLGLRPLVVSFGRSGNSSESVGAMDLLDDFCPQRSHDRTGRHDGCSRCCNHRRRSLIRSGPT